MKPRLLLIHPFKRSKTGDFAETDAFGIPSLSLMQVAGLTPDNWDITLIDERYDEIDFDQAAELVGITTYSSVANRAFEISREFGKRNIPVVIGGIHVSLAPEEAMQYCDSVVIGEAESVWETVLNDTLAGKLQKSYTGDRVSMENLPHPKRDLYEHEFMMDVIQTSRGCPFNCSFCSAQKFSGSKIRSRPIDDILDELETIKKKIVYVLDDNFYGASPQARDRVKEFCRGIIERKIKKYFIIQASLNLHSDAEILKLLAKSGVILAYIGIESVEEENLKEMSKRANLKVGVSGIKAAVKSFHRHKIAVCASLIFGNDHDTVQTFNKTLKFLKQTNIDAFDINVLTPFPQTRVYDKLMQEDRLFYHNFPKDWQYFDIRNVTFKLKQLTTESLYHGIAYLVTKKTSLLQCFLQFFKTLILTRRLSAGTLALVNHFDNRDLFHIGKKLKKLAM